MSIKTIENKNLLLHLLEKHPIKMYVNHNTFIDIFNSQIDTIHRNKFKFNNNLTEMNKQVLSNIQTITNNYIKRTNPPNHTINHSTNKKIKLNNPTSPMIFPRPMQDEYKSTKRDKPTKLKLFENKLKEQQDNFNSLNKKDKPKDIDFSDKVEEDAPIKLSILDDAMKQRENELRNIIKNNKPDKKVEKWLTGKNTMTDARKNEPSDISEKETIIYAKGKPKKVTFDTTDTIITDVSSNKDDIQDTTVHIQKLKPDNNVFDLNNDNFVRILNILNMQNERLDRYETLLNNILINQEKLINTK